MNRKADELGDKSIAQVWAANRFLSKTLRMSAEEVQHAQVVEACWSRDVFLCVRFASVEAARGLNKFKKNLPKQHLFKIFNRLVYLKNFINSIRTSLKLRLLKFSFSNFLQQIYMTE